MLLNFQNFIIRFLRLILCIQILMYGNLDLLVKSVTVVKSLIVFRFNVNHFFVKK